MRNDITDTKESKIFSWFERFIGRAKKPEVTWPFPFREGRMFVLTIRAGVDGYHINAGGRHVTSFPYRMVNYSQFKFTLYTFIEILLSVLSLIIINLMTFDAKSWVIFSH